MFPAQTNLSGVPVSQLSLAKPTTNTQAVTTVQPTPIVPPPPVTPGSTANDTTAKVTPIVSANAAMEHYTNAQNLLNTTQQGMTQQAQNAQAAQANAGQQGTQKTPPAGWDPQTYASFKAANPNLEPTAQDTAKMQAATPDNSDLTGALKGATDALNAGNGMTAPDKTAYDQKESDLATEQNDIDTKLNDINTQITQSSDQFQQSVNQIQNGTFPLTPTQQGLLQGTQQAVQAANQSAQQTAQIYAQMAKTFGAVHGLSQYNPGAVQQAISAEMAKGAAEISKVQLDGVKQMADLQRGFQNDDFDMIQSSYDALQKSLDSKQKILSDLSTRTQKMAEDAQKQYMDEVKQYKDDVQNAITNTFKSIELNDSEKKTVFDQAMQSAEFDEKQKQNLADNYFKGQQLSLDKQKVAISQQDLAFKIQQAQNSEDTVKNQVANNIQTTLAGQKYFDPSQYTGQDKTAAIEAATTLGAPIVTKDEAATLSSSDEVRQNNQTILDYLSDLLPKDPAGRITAMPGTKLSKIFQTDDKKAAFDTFQSAAIKTLRALAGSKGLRINQAEINLSIARDIPSLNDTLSVANQKLKNINSLLDNSDNTILVKDRSTLPGGSNSGTVLTGPDGKQYNVPANQVDAFLKAGGKR